jgi:hypothetical protein
MADELCSRAQFASGRFSTRRVEMKLMKSALLTLTILFLIGAVAVAQQPNFSGAWVMNKDKCDYTMGRDGAKPDISMKIEQTGDTLKINRKIASPMGEREENMTLVANGQEQEVEGFMGRPSKVSANWDGAILAINTVRTFERDGQEMKIPSQDRWELSADGKVLTNKGKSQRPSGEERTYTQVFDKQ